MGRNISTEIKAGKPKAQAVAIAFSTLMTACGVKSDKKLTPKEIVARSGGDEEKSQRKTRDGTGARFGGGFESKKHVSSVGGGNFNEDFADHFGKGKWHRLTLADMKKYPELVDEFLDLLKSTYAKIGGSATIKGPADLLNGEITVFEAIDLDADPQADAIRLGREKSAGIKGVASAQDGSPEAKKAVLDKTAKELKTQGFYAEMSDALAHIMLTKYGAPSVNKQEDVEKVLGKKVEWVGKRPDGKYPDHAGWYIRTIGGTGPDNKGGEKHMKILLGKPRGVSESTPRFAALFEKFGIDFRANGTPRGTGISPSASGTPDASMGRFRAFSSGGEIVSGDGRTQITKVNPYRRKQRR